MLARAANDETISHFAQFLRGKSCSPDGRVVLRAQRSWFCGSGAANPRCGMLPWYPGGLTKRGASSGGGSGPLRRRVRPRADRPRTGSPGPCSARFRQRPRALRHSRPCGVSGPRPRSTARDHGRCWRYRARKPPCCFHWNGTASDPVRVTRTTRWARMPGRTEWTRRD